MDITDITPKTKFYIINNAKVVACRFDKVEIGIVPYSSWKAINDRPIDFCFVGSLILADGSTRSVTDLDMIKFYLNAKDATAHTNRINFQLHISNLWKTLGDCGCTPLANEFNLGGSNYISLASWVWKEVNDYVGEVKSVIKAVDTFNHRLCFERNGFKSWDVKWWNTRKECIAANKVEVVDFPDEVQEESVYEQLESLIHEQGGYLKLKRAMAISIEDEEGKERLIQIKGLCLVDEGNGAVEMYAIDGKFEAWCISDYLSNEQIEMLYKVVSQSL